MKIVVPAYYNKFRCIADKCKHTCCTGWEIGIDDETYKLYSETDSQMSKHISEQIIVDSDGPQFKTDENKKCPFLLENGLCDIIIKKGEGWLCQICRDHPRFKNYFSDRIEIGLGMCCEEAARLIITSEDSSLVFLKKDIDSFPDSDEREFFDERKWIFGCIKNENCAEGIINKIRERYPIVSFGEAPGYWYEIISELECMSNSREKYFKYMKDIPEFEMPFGEFEIKAYKNILTYYIYRYFFNVFDGYSPETCLSFCLLSTQIIFHIYLSIGDKNLEILSDIARLFSSEIEYSQENTEIMMDEIDFIIHSSDVLESTF